MPVKFTKPEEPMTYTPDQKTPFTTTSVRLPTKVLMDLKRWADECSDETNNGSLNDLINQILIYGLKHKGKK